MKVNEPTVINVRVLPCRLLSPPAVIRPLLGADTVLRNPSKQPNAPSLRDLLIE